MKKPEGKPIGTITINVYKGGVSIAEMKGEVPPNVIMMSRMTLQRGYREYIAEKGKTELRALEEKKRVAAQAEQQQQQEQDQIDAEKVFAENTKKSKLAKLKADLETMRSIDPMSLASPEERKQRMGNIKQLTEEIEALEKDLVVDNKEQEGTENGEETE